AEVKMGGAIGVADNTSHLTITNSILWNNMGNGLRNSYSSNNGIDIGGNIIVSNTAAETTSKKFNDADDTNVTILDATVTPGFVAPGTTIGNTTIEEIEAANYRLAAGSLCIDAGDEEKASHLAYDLDCTTRSKGMAVDMGAYEYDEETSIEEIAIAESEGITIIGGTIFVNVSSATELAIYRIDGQKVMSKSVAAGMSYVKVPTLSGIYIVRAGEKSTKIVIK
ncbi:MAG: hypothetical protein HUK03_09540, partial [Bacteroidaceae bacterium]|nr:hypothetical protein [Bacteroidaceae bacterium]